MDSYRKRYGADAIAAFRKGDQALSGSAFPLLQGRYAAIMDGQWRVRELYAAQAAAKAAGRTVHEYGVVPLPPPTGGKKNAGWVNGNFFLVPRGSNNPAGAWAFMKFWSGFGGHEREAARACAKGGWIPASRQVVEQPEFQAYLDEQPMFRTFVELASSPNQVPIPPVPVAAFYQSEVIRAAEQALYLGRDPQTVLQNASAAVRQQLQATRAGR
jgi:multiple sugar transport system substrate-binding protein